jgi:hypothetical protein
MRPKLERRLAAALTRGLPVPSAAYRRRAWLEFQRAIDPLAQPRRLRLLRR